MEATNKLTYKKSELSSLAQIAKKEVFKNNYSGELSVVLSFIEKGEPVRVNLVFDFDGWDVQSIMQAIRKKISNFLMLKGHRIAFTFTFGDKTADTGLFGLDFVFSGKKDERFKLFNAWFILAYASYAGIEVNETSDEV